VFASIEDVQERLVAQKYVSDRRLATVVFLAMRIAKPILVEGPAGVGKTELAKVLAAALGRELIRLQCYEGLDESKALYEWEYGKQLLYTQVLREKIGSVIGPAEDLKSSIELLSGQEDVFFSDAFLVERPILRAVRSVEPTVLLVDEIDRADEEFEAFLLEFLADRQVTIPEIGTIEATAPPLVVLTSNRSRELSEALKRRCLHLQIDYPGPETELEIVHLKVPEVAPALAQAMVDLIADLRAQDLRKAPSIGETLDWAQALVVLGAAELTRELVEDTLSVIIKYDRDADRVRARLAAANGAAGVHGHSHGPGHSHSHPHAHADHTHDDAAA